MSEEKFNKFERGVFQILRLTHLDEMRWSRKAELPLSLTIGANSSFPYYFEAGYGGKYLGLFRERSRRAVSDSDERWSERVGLVLLDASHEVEFEFPMTPFTDDLFEAVRIKESNVDDFLNVLMQSEPQGVKI